MEKQLYAKSNTHNNNLTHTFDRIFTKARGVQLFPEEKLDFIKKIEKMHMATAPVAIQTKKEKVH